MGVEYSVATQSQYWQNCDRKDKLRYACSFAKAACCCDIPEIACGIGIVAQHSGNASARFGTRTGKKHFAENAFVCIF